MLVELSEKAQVIVVENTPPNEMLQYVKVLIFKWRQRLYRLK